ncbi:proline-rich protein 2-like [Chionomys nivalis]|uniref:proline-rich protein 2-like n=1 Tax=Chionomys nivalis TaxID=269649 RepID=UPI0025957352|nr:proline-rich protein 2-like [Chionomys nivalis]
MAASAPPAEPRTPLTSAGRSCASAGLRRARRPAALARRAAPGPSPAGPPLPWPRPRPASRPPGEFAAAPSLRPRPGPPRQPRPRAAPPRRGPAPSPPPPHVSRGSPARGAFPFPHLGPQPLPSVGGPRTRGALPSSTRVHAPSYKGSMGLPTRLPHLRSQEGQPRLLPRWDPSPAAPFPHPISFPPLHPTSPPLCTSQGPQAPLAPLFYICLGCDLGTVAVVASGKVRVAL